MTDSIKYFSCGLTIESELELPELLSISDNKKLPDIHIRVGSISDELYLKDKEKKCHEVDQDTYYFYVGDTGRYLISQGRDILVETFPGASELNIRLFLLGSAFGILLHQREVLPLHASAINVNGKAAAFVGDSGAGKSTTIAFLHRAGYEVLGDDICPVFLNKHRVPLAWTSFPRIKLWSDALEEFGYDKDVLIKDSVQDDKFHLPLEKELVTDPIPLTRVYVINEQESETGDRIKVLKGRQAMEALLNNVYRSEMFTSDQHQERIFRQCAGLADHLDVFQLNRSKDFTLMEEVIEELRSHFTNDEIVESDVKVK